MQSLFWTFPAIMISSIVIGWAAELAALHMSAGLALAILALLQTLPEFGVEAYISWSGNTHLMLANLTGSLRLFVGLGWPMVYVIHYIYSQKGSKPLFIALPKTFAVEASFLAIPVGYFYILGLRGQMHLYDGFVLCGFYLMYLAYLNYQRIYLKHATEELSEEEEDLAGLPKYLSKKSLRTQYRWILALFVAGGVVLFSAVHPFVEGLKHTAMALGMTEFVFIQWVAPFASEFPEKVTAFGWARKASKVPMAIFNMVSSSVNQWTLLAGFVPIVYSISLGRAATIEFDRFQHLELMLTVAQSVLGILFLADLKFHWFEALALMGLWLVQFLIPSTRELILVVYILLCLMTTFRFLFLRRWPRAWREFYVLNQWILKRWLS